MLIKKRKTRAKGKTKSTAFSSTFIDHRTAWQLRPQLTHCRTAWFLPGVTQENRMVHKAKGKQQQKILLEIMMEINKNGIKLFFFPHDKNKDSIFLSM